MKLTKGLFALALTTSLCGCSAFSKTEEGTTQEVTTQESSASSDSINLSENNPVISGEGTYTLTGSLKDEAIVVDAGQSANITLILDNVSVSNTKGNALTIKSADNVTIILKEGTTNVLEDGGYTVSQEDDAINAALYSTADLTITGQGTLVVNGNVNHGIYTQDDLVVTSGNIEVYAKNDGLKGHDSLTIESGTFKIQAEDKALISSRNNEKGLGSVIINGGDFVIESGGDGIHAEGELTINAGNIDIQKSGEGLEGKYITINDGTVNIYASDDGINAGDPNNSNSDARQDASITIAGGNITVEMASGDTDAIDSNGDLTITGGTLTITAQFGFDFNGNVTFTGGEVTLNGENLTTIENSMMRGGNGMRNNQQNRKGGWS